MSVFIKIFGIFLTFCVIDAHGAALPKMRKVLPKEYLKSIPQKSSPKKRVKPNIESAISPPKEGPLTPFADSKNEDPSSRELKSSEPLEKDLSWVIRSKELPWEELPNGERRKIYKEATIQLQLIEVVASPKHTSTYKENVTCYVIQGDVHVLRQGQENLKVSAGDTFFLPAGHPFMRKTGPTVKNAFLVEFFSPAENTTSQQEELSKNEVIGFVHRWFALLDQKADISHFLKHLGNKIYKISFTEPAITSKSQFQQWYERKFVKTIYSNSYQIGNIHVNTQNIQDGLYEIFLDITWVATRKDKKDIENFYQEKWLVQKEPTLPLGFTILEYKVQQVPTKASATPLREQSFGGPQKFFPKTPSTTLQEEEEEDLWDDEDSEEDIEEENESLPKKSKDLQKESEEFTSENQPPVYTFSG